MIKVIKIFILSVFALLIFGSCGGQPSSGLSISVVPNQPVLVPVGSGTTVGGFFQISAPYFSVSSLNLVWTGTSQLNIVAILITSPQGSTYSVSCGFGGDDLTHIFPNNLSPTNSEVLIKAAADAQHPVSVVSNALGCGGVITVPTPIPTSFNIPLQVEVVGVTLDSNNNTTGRVLATTNITVQ